MWYPRLSLGKDMTLFILLRNCQNSFNDGFSGHNLHSNLPMIISSFRWNNQLLKGNGVSQPQFEYFTFWQFRMNIEGPHGYNYVGSPKTGTSVPGKGWGSINQHPEFCHKTISNWKIQPWCLAQENLNEREDQKTARRERNRIQRERQRVNSKKIRKSPEKKEGRKQRA